LIKTAVTVPENADIDKFAKEVSIRVIDEYEDILLKRLTEAEFGFLAADEKKKIYLRAKENAKVKNGEILTTIHYNRRRMLIEVALIDFFKEERNLNIEGFVNFRLESYKDELKEIISSAAEEIKAESECEEFLEMIRLFISVQYPKEETVHIVKRKNGLRILNQRKKDITGVYTEEHHANEKFAGEDIILSSLIEIAPEKIVIHDEEQSEKIYSTIKKIFPEVFFRERKE